MSAKRTKRVVLYNCDICAAWHTWEWDGDCRDDANRYAAPEVYAERHGVDVDTIVERTMDERVAADMRGAR